MKKLTDELNSRMEMTWRLCELKERTKEITQLSNREKTDLKHTNKKQSLRYQWDYNTRWNVLFFCIFCNVHRVFFLFVLLLIWQVTLIHISTAKPLLHIFVMICYPFLIVEFYLLTSYEEFLHLHSWKYWKKRHII